MPHPPLHLMQKSFRTRASTKTKLAEVLTRQVAYSLLTLAQFFSPLYLYRNFWPFPYGILYQLNSAQKKSTTVAYHKQSRNTSIITTLYRRDQN